MNNANLEMVNNIKDLGILVDTELRWDVHINDIVKRAKTKMWLLIRNLGFNAPIKTKKVIYTSLVRSKVEYGSPLWNPHLKYLLEELERVQRRATNYITNNPRRPSPNHINYKTRLLQLNLLPLSYRREVLDITFFLKSFHGKTGYDVGKYLRFSDEQAPRETRRATLGNKLVVRKSGRGQNVHFFPSRIARIWNALPDNVRQTLRTVSESLIVKQVVNPYYYYLLEHHFESENTCTWVNSCPCYRCKLV